MEWLLAHEAWSTASLVNARQPAPLDDKEALARRWLAERRIFAVTFEGTALFPSYQFGPTGQPHPVIEAVLEVFGAVEPRVVAAWFAFPNAWISRVSRFGMDAVAPREALGRAEEVLHAARIRCGGPVS